MSYSGSGSSPPPFVTPIESSTGRAGEPLRIEATMIAAATREQLRLGRDLHDSLGQELATALMLLVGLEKRIAEAAPGLVPAAAEIRAAVGRALESMRTIVRGLAPSGLEGSGLIRTLAQLATRCGQDGRIRFDFTGPETLPPLPAGVAEHLYRFAQEAVANVVRHARATSVDIRLAIEGPELELSVRDDGAGFDPQTVAEQGGMGLRIMQFRAHSLDGRLAVESNPMGTRVALRVPLLPRNPPGDTRG